MFVVLTKTHINHIFIGSLIATCTDYDPISSKLLKVTMFQKCEYVYKVYKDICQLNLGWRNMASVSLHIDLKNRASDFWHMHILLFFKRAYS